MSASAARQFEASGFDQTHFLESLVCDLQWTCLHAGTIHYLIQAAGHQGRPAQLAAWRHLLGDNTGALQLGLRYGEDIGLAAPVVTAVIEFLDVLAGGLARTHRLLRQAGAHAPIPHGELRHLQAPWAEIARRAERALALLDPATRASLSPEYAANARIILGFLQEGMRGDTHRLNQWGELALPVVAQRRLHARAVVARLCTIEWRGQAVEATLINASRGGLGLRCRQELPRGETVVVRLDEGRRLQARVMRCESGEIGLHLLHPLAHGDALFGG